MKKFLKNFEDAMAAAAFAQAGETETAVEIMEESRASRKREKELRVQDERPQSILERHDAVEEAIVFAQAGEHEYAQKVLEETKKENQKILVVGGEEGFSDKLMDYALNMAGRMNHEIVALNIIPVGKQLFRFLSEKKVTEELQAKPEKGAAIFRAKTETREIAFQHMVKFGGFDRVIKDIHREIRRISFVLTEPDHICDEESCANASIPVFCMAPEEV